MENIALHFFVSVPMVYIPSPISPRLLTHEYELNLANFAPSNSRNKTFQSVSHRAAFFFLGGRGGVRYVKWFSTGMMTKIYNGCLCGEFARLVETS